MKPRPPKLPHLLLAAASLCGLALLAMAERPAEAEGSAVASALPEASMIQAADEGAATTPRQLRRRHGALSMPYFSFARSLRPGS